MAVDLARETALKILYDITENHAYSNISVNRHLENDKLREIDRSFATELVYGTVKWLLQIDYVLGKYSSVKLKKLSPWIKNILRLGIYQLLHTDRIPVSAACNTGVELAKRYGHQASSRFVNAVLRNIAKSKNNIPYPDKSDNVNYLSILYSHPVWMVEKWIELYGTEFTEELLKSNNQVPDFIIRTNTLKTDRVTLLDMLHKEGISAEPGRYIEEAVILKSPSSITNLEVFKNGYFQVQDESSMLAAKILDPKEGETVIDVCSAPGGKATHMAQLMNNKGTIIARDVYQHKLKLIEQSCCRLGIDIIKTEIHDACCLDETFTGKADRVLIDAPCSGLGIIRKKPDIKYSRTEKELREITGLQREILKNSSKYLKPGGYLLYSTCTIQQEENLDIVSDFLEDNPDFRLTGFQELMPPTLDIASSAEGYIQLFPNINQTDGFFISKIKREK
ncbi:16S rRNA (cytosine(967)-C(5))-methyltransferase RsmB [Ruminiclostridium cellulolyticum]|uniref:16S rRNA (cytosine(967)-C(5))-methyltransferase n=1 Tax=Ruminiclostridium cellulolyticum (strain ATCC 35319 / DSM 5812 / JCM 6584 / H10) TaxID=394503 RepID=B8I258_RUMCH|nr:16S rRNA (cytosine(967)-C(5))-methyltransferase RsmB [Ruminiclostridium cellulolyticum]ACL75884.1 sun protein [Ruminiclostridium cellulolyticum H10]